MWPPAEVVAALAELDVPGRAVRLEKLHVTLRFLGADDFDPASLPLLPPAEAQLGPVTATFGRSVLQVPVAGLDGLAAAVDPAPVRPFAGHLTLARARGRDDLRRAAGVAVPPAARVPWPVTEVTLVASAGGRYEVVARFPVG